MLLSNEEIKKEIADGRISAITLDTSVFDASQNDFEHGGLAQLGQFLGSNTHFVISDVVAGEIKSHLLRDARKAESEVKNALKGTGGAWHTSRATRTAAMSLLFSGETAEEMFDRRYGAFEHATGLKTISSGALVDLNSLLEDYFSAKPPFGTNVTKKNEFPDAIALHALEGWAAEVATRMLVVSNDGDWKAYCGPSPNLVFVDDLSEALSMFHADLSVVCAIFSEMMAKETLDIKGSVADPLMSAVEGIDFIPEANAAYYYETEVSEVEVEDFEFLPIGDLPTVMLKPIGRDDDCVAVQAQLNVKISVTTSFSFSVKDYIDRDQVPMGSASISRSIELHAKAFIHLSGDFSKDPEIDRVDIEFERGSVDVDYGEVGPDWGDDS